MKTGMDGKDRILIEYESNNQWFWWPLTILEILLLTRNENQNNFPYLPN